MANRDMDQPEPQQGGRGDKIERDEEKTGGADDMRGIADEETDDEFEDDEDLDAEDTEEEDKV